MSMRTFWTVWIGQLVSQVGTAMTGFAMTIWVAGHERHRSVVGGRFPRDGAWGGPRQKIRGMLVLMAVGGVGLVAAGLRPDPVVAVGGSMLLMLVVPIVGGTSQTLWHTKVAPAIQGRVFSTRRMIASIATPIAFVSAGPVADRVFEPLLMPDGPLAESLGGIWGTGVGRGSALLISCVGVAVMAIALVAWLTPSIRNIERDIPDALEATRDSARGDGPDGPPSSHRTVAPAETR